MLKIQVDLKKGISMRATAEKFKVDVRYVRYCKGQIPPSESVGLFIHHNQHSLKRNAAQLTTLPKLN